MANPKQRLVQEPDQVEFLRQRRGLPRQQAAAEFNERFGRDLKPIQISHQLRVWGAQLSQDEERALKGIVRRPDGKMVAGSAAPPHAFKPGYVPPHASPIGAERQTPDGPKRKVAGRPKGYEWVYIRTLNWIETHGPIPRGMKLICLGDKQDPSPDNYMLVPLGAVARASRRWPGGLTAAPAGLRRTIIGAAIVEHQLEKTPATSSALIPANVGTLG